MGEWECWSAGVLECWSAGVLECWSVGTRHQRSERPQPDAAGLLTEPPAMRLGDDAAGPTPAGSVGDRPELW